MKVENPIALSFILQDELYLLDKDKAAFNLPEPQPIPEILPANLKCLGKNKKSFLVVVSYAEFEFINDDHLNALENILKRKGLSLDDVAIYNIYSNTDINYTALADFFKPQKMLLLGQNSIPAGLNDLILNKNESRGGIETLYSFSFDEMMSNNENKRVFWEQMKLL